MDTYRTNTISSKRPDEIGSLSDIIQEEDSFALNREEKGELTEVRQTLIESEKRRSSYSSKKTTEEIIEENSSLNDSLVLSIKSLSIKSAKSK